MTWYVVVTRDKHRTVISRHPSVQDAGNRIHRERAFATWTVLGQDGRLSSQARPLNKQEQARLEEALWPGLFD